MFVTIRSLIKLILIYLSFFNGICPLYAENNLALYRIVFHSSSVDEHKCGHLAVDGSLKTYWESNATGSQWLSVDLGHVYDISRVNIHWGANYAEEFTVKLLQFTDEKASPVYTRRHNRDSLININFSSRKARIILIDISSVIDGSSGCIIKEVQVWGEGDDRFKKSAITPLTTDDLSLNGTIWRVQNTMFVSDSPENISSEGFNDKDWIPATVPGTIMGSYHEFGALPDPLYSDNMHQISDEFFSGNDFWYRTSVKLPELSSGERLFLNFRGINWKADVYFNSVRLGRIDGAYQRAEFEVTGLLSKYGINTVAVLIHHSENWRSGERKIKRRFIGAPTRNGDNLGYDSPAILASAGWNWLPIIRGRNTGIWQEAGFQIRGDVSITDPWVVTKVLLPDTTKAVLTIHAELKNHSPKSVKGYLVARAGTIDIKLPVKLKPKETRTITLDNSRYEQLLLNNPRLWWPNGYGKAELYDLSIQFHQSGKISDNKNVTFGIRQLDTRVENDILFFFCNGQKILIRGGNWGLPEAMLRCDSAGYDLRVRLHRDANFNMIRNWVGMTGHEAFYDVCDKYGILIWDDFWLANPVDGPDPKDNVMFMNNVRDKIKWVRSHPSLALYCGRNEGYPPKELDSAMNIETLRLDGTRRYIPHSSEGTVTGLGPYDLREPAWYFSNRGITFHSELGIVAFPEYETLRRMMPPEYLWPVNDMWAYHDYQWGRSEKFTARIEERFGPPDGAADYSRRAQLLNYETAKAMFESLQSNQGSGILLWMSQSAWPSMICQIYDHYFEYTSAFFAVKNACKQVHVFYDILKKEIRVANNTGSDIRNATVKAFILDSEGTTIWQNTNNSDIKPASAVTAFKIGPWPSDEVKFLKLELTVDGKILDDNFYWLENSNGNCRDLNDLPASKVSVNLAGNDDAGIYKINIKNISRHISVLNKIRIRDKASGESILPVFFSDNYISLIPGEEKEITFRVEEKELKNRSSEIWIEGWNTEPVKTDLITEF